MTLLPRKARGEVVLGVAGDTVFVGDHIAYFYETDAEFQRAFGFLDVGLQGADHCVIFGVPDDIDRALDAVRGLGWDTDALISSGRLSIMHPAATSEETADRVSQHFAKLLAAGAPLIRFIGNAAVSWEVSGCGRIRQAAGVRGAHFTWPTPRSAGRNTDSRGRNCDAASPDVPRKPPS
jgi:hypothetical protein